MTRACVAFYTVAVSTRFLLACALAGCSFSVDGAGDGVIGVRDGSVDSPIDTPVFPCYGAASGFVRVCLTAAAPPAFDVTTETTLDTDSSDRCAVVTGTNTAGACVVVADTIRIMDRLDAIGSKPLVLVATTTLVVDGKIDAASHRSGNLGPGASSAVCTTGSPATGTGGGAGGSFTGLGGGGGGTGGGSPGPITAVPTTLRGGCRGMMGSSLGGGAGGAGGGAVYAIAGTSITVTGSINASGRGGDGGSASVNGAGGGGGSGGMIGLEAPMLEVAGAVFANGGGGSEGSDGTVAGVDGADPTDGAVAAGGGDGASTGGAGGSGAAGATVTGGGGGAGAVGASGGGGGGGGAGLIKLVGTRTGSGLVSPPPT